MLNVPHAHRYHTTSFPSSRSAHNLELLVETWMIHEPMTFRTAQEGWRFVADARMADLEQEAQRHKEKSHGVREEA